MTAPHKTPHKTPHKSAGVSLARPLVYLGVAAAIGLGSLLLPSTGSAPRPPTPATTAPTNAPGAACSEVPQPVTWTGSPAAAAARTADASAAAWLSGPAWRAAIRRARPGSASIISVMWYGGPERGLGVPVKAHGSGGPGRGAVGSKAASVLIGRG